MAKPSKTSPGYKILLVALSLVVALLICEATLQGVFRARNGKWLWQSRAFGVDYTMPVDDRREFTLRPGFSDSRLSISDMGFRSPMPQNFQAPLVACLGDSVPFGYGVPNQAAYPILLDRFFQQTGSPVEVLNAGVSSYNLRQSVDRLQKDVLPFFPNLRAVTLQAANDLSLLTHFQDRYTPDLTWAADRYQDSWPKHWLLRSALVWHLHDLLERQGKQEPAAVSVNERNPGPLPRQVMLHNLDKTLDRLSQMAMEENFVVILLPIDPFYHEKNEPGLDQELPQYAQWKGHRQLWKDLVLEYNQHLKNAAEKHGRFFYLDLRTLMDRAGRSDKYLDYIHYSPVGHRMVAQALVAVLNQPGILPDTASFAP